MNRNSGLAHAVARVLMTGALLATLGVALAQTAPADRAPAARGAAEAATAEPPRRNRERRRSAAVVAATAAAGSTATAAEPPAPAADEAEAQIVCKNIKLTGTKISRRICGTEAQWAAQQKRTTDDAQEAMRQVRDRSSIVVNQPDNPLSPGPN